MHDYSPPFSVYTSSLAICLTVLEDSGSSVDTSFDPEQHACTQPAAFLSRRTRVMLATQAVVRKFIVSQASTGDSHATNDYDKANCLNKQFYNNFNYFHPTLNTVPPQVNPNLEY